MTFLELRARLERAGNMYPNSTTGKGLEDIVAALAEHENYSLMTLVAVDLARYIDQQQSGKKDAP